MTQYGRDYIGGMMTIIGSSGQVMSREDAEAQMVLDRVSGWGDAEIVGAAPMLVRQAPALPQRAAMFNPRVATALATGLRMPFGPMPLPQFPTAGLPQSHLVPVGQTGPHVAETNPGPVGLALVPMNSNGNVLAGGTQVINVQPQSIFKPYRLTVDPVIAAFFMITNLQIGTVPLFDAPGEVACSNFPPNLQQGNLKKITANPGIQISMTVRNRDGVAHPFWSTMFGEAAPTQCG